MEPKPPPEENRSPVPENQENEQKEHALVDHQSKGSPHCEGEDIKKAKSLEFFKAKVFEFARDSRMSPERILLIERRLPELVIDLHVPDHPPYATMIHKAITELDETGGSTEEAISLCIKKEQNDLPWAHASLLKHHLKKLCEMGDVVVTGEKCYMLNNACETYIPDQIKAFDPSQIVAVDPYQIGASPIPSYGPYSSPSSSTSGSYSDYAPYVNKRKQKRTGRKYGKKRRSGRKMQESEEEFDINEEEHPEDTEEEEDSEEYEDEFEEFKNTEEEAEVTKVENRLIKYKRKHTHRTEGAKKNKTEDKSEFKDEWLGAVSVDNPVIGMNNRGTKLVRGRGRPPKYSKPKTYIGPREAQVELIETHNQVAEVPKLLKQKRGRGRPSKIKGFETQTRPKETQELSWETHNQLRGVLNRAEESMERGSPPKKLGTNTDFGPKEVHKEVTKAFNQATEDLKMPGEKRGRGRPPKNLGSKTYVRQKEAQGEVIDSYNQMDCMEKPQQKRGPGRPPKNSGGELVVIEEQKRGPCRPPKNSGGELVVIEEQKRGPGRPPKNSGGELVVIEEQNLTNEDGMKLKQGRRRFRRKHEREEVNKYLDQLELTVIQEMFEKMKISCDDGENVYGPASPCFSSKACEPVVDDKMRKEKEQNIQSSVGWAELFDKHGWEKLREKSQELDDIEKLSGTPIQLPREGKEDEAYPCRLASRSETDEFTTMNEMAPAQFAHEEQQPGCIGQGGPPGYRNMTTKAPPTVSNYQHEDVQQQHIHTGKEPLLEIEEETSTFMELLHSGYRYQYKDKQLDQSKNEGGRTSSEPTHCTGEDDKNSECNK
ncbi:hypothetical protein DCAR_0208239 [Daucus carota subsp. sativus]|uniref:H15 domain-containing protein n=1 Tax=Daucus carota subsp. sativus TaxID=79200 RepID=A0AAF0WIR9_DAUCS|nr:PREDICTED: uncharacterized protein LOC108205591 isoform X2 [Daucus carota subsp. sativus]WOG89003.1 hypothetical protein DCAR_0208239 [Daucus carota subsp. sativus]